jgi:hypothetical protein
MNDEQMIQPSPRPGAVPASDTAANRAPAIAPSRRQILFLIAVSAVVAVIAGVSVWLVMRGGVDPTLFGRMQAKVAATHSLTMSLPVFCPAGAPDNTAYFLPNGRARFEAPDGVTLVFDPATERALTLDSARKTALLVIHHQYRRPDNPYPVIRDIRTAQVKSLGMQNLEGKRMAVFLARLDVKPGTIDLKVWVDPQTELPTQLEFQNRAWKGRGRFDYDLATQLIFDQPLDEELFSTEPPPAYTLREEDLKTSAP